MNSAIANRVTLFFSFVGIFVAGVLSLGKFLHVSVPCGASHGCDTVASDPSSYLFGVIPIAYIGLGAYLVFAACAALRAHLGPTRLLVFGPLLLSVIGAVIHVGLAIYASTKINATCLWCMASLATMICLFVSHAVIAQGQEIFKKNERLDLGLLFGFAVLACGGLGFEGAQMRHGVAPTYDPAILRSLTNENLAPSDSHVYGDPNAPVTIVEYGDLFCPACRNSYPEVKKLVDSHHGALRLVFRHFPLVKEKGHEFSWQAAELSEYAGQRGKFWEFLDAMYKHTSEDVMGIDDLLGIAQKVGLDGAHVDIRWDDESDPSFQRVYRDFALAFKLGLQMTPTFFILAKGEPPLVAAEGEIESDLNQPQYTRLMSGNAKK